MQIGDFTGGGAPGVNDHHLHLRTLLFGGFDALKQDRMAPGGVGTGEHDQVGQFQVRVTGGHAVFTERPFVGGHRGRHA